MCGIAGIFAWHDDAPPIDRAELARVSQRMAARGPDGQGEWYSADARVALAHRRLAIIDLSSNGAQPMSTADGRLVVTFNGEIYNYRELRTQLVAKGYVFRSDSDTEVLLHLYAEKGEAMVDDLRGMFAFAIWDEQRRGLFLARDPFGIKPLYIAEQHSTLRFASQVKALLHGGGIDTRAEPAGHAGFFVWGHIPEPYTLYRGIKALPAGSTLWLDGQGRRRQRRYWSINAFYRRVEGEAAIKPQCMPNDALSHALLDSVRHHLIADVPIGTFLSAGLDSTTIASLAKEAEVHELNTVTLAFREFQGTANDEAPLAERVAAALGACHRTCLIERADFEAERERLLDAMDQPSIDGVNTYFVSKVTREAGLKVALSGLGGDEVFGGYSTFRNVPRAVSYLGPLARCPTAGKALRRAANVLVGRRGGWMGLSPKYAGLFEYGGSWAGSYLLQRAVHMPWDLPGLLDPDFAARGWDELRTLAELESTAEGIQSPRLKVSALEVEWYMRNQLLRDSDWASMTHGLELRVPLLDVPLLETVARLHTNGKPADKNAMAAAPRRPLPDALRNRPKSGFGIPVREWLMTDLAPAERHLQGWARHVYASFASTKAA